LSCSAATRLQFSLYASNQGCARFPYIWTLQFIGRRRVRVFRFMTGKLRCTIDESAEAAAELQRGDSPAFRLDAIDFGRRLAAERELAGNPAAPAPNAVFDDSGNFILYSTLLGIKARRGIRASSLLWVRESYDSPREATARPCFRPMLALVAAATLSCALSCSASSRALVQRSSHPCQGRTSSGTEAWHRTRGRESRMQGRVQRAQVRPLQRPALHTESRARRW